MRPYSIVHESFTRKHRRTPHNRVRTKPYRQKPFHFPVLNHLTRLKQCKEKIISPFRKRSFSHHGGSSSNLGQRGKGQERQLGLITQLGNRVGHKRQRVCLDVRKRYVLPDLPVHLQSERRRRRRHLSDFGREERPVGDHIHGRRSDKYDIPSDVLPGRSPSPSLSLLSSSLRGRCHLDSRRGSRVFAETLLSFGVLLLLGR